MTMTSAPIRLVLLFAVFCTPWLLSEVRAQQANQRALPHLAYVYPAGGQAGTTLKVAVGGQNLGELVRPLITGKGIKAKLLEYHRPMTQKEFNDLREKIDQLEKRRTEAKAAKKAEGNKEVAASWTEADEKELQDLRMKRERDRPNRGGNPALAETVILELSIDPGFGPEIRELRLGSPRGLSNPLQFCIGQVPEVLADEVVAAQPVPKRLQNQQVAVARKETKLSIPAVANGQIMPGGVERFRFQAKKGQKLVFTVAARSLIPYLADAVPGWFQATLTLLDAKGKALAYDDDFRFNPDPVLFFEVPADGEYVAEIKDSIYRGREDFVYRLSIGEFPFITSLYPLGGHAGAKTEVEIHGWNLPTPKGVMDATGRSPGTFLLSVRSGELLSNPAGFALDDQPEVSEVEPNDSPAKAQSLTPSVIVNGMIGKVDDVDVYRLEGKAGQKIVAELQARRLNSPLDSYLRLTDAQGNQVAFNDDHEDKGLGLSTHHADSYLMLSLPADGTYYLSVGDAQHHGGPAYAYRLHVREPRPDFQLRATPSSINVRAGSAVPVTVYALRRDGFQGEIRLGLNKGWENYALSGAVIPEGQDKVRITVTAKGAASDEPDELQLVGVAKVAGGELAREAVPAEDMMQAFAYRHLVPAQRLLAMTLVRAPLPQVVLDVPMPFHLKPGKKNTLQLSLRVQKRAEQLHFELNEAPEGLSLSSQDLGGFGASLEITCDPAKMKPGTRGNLILEVFAERNRGKNEKGKNQNAQKNPLGFLPAIPFVVDEP